jgi:hypothetical protein
MTITYNKHIVSLSCYSEIDSETNVVFTINWTLVGNEGVFCTSLSCATSVPYVSGQPLIPYSELTESQILQWIEDHTSTEDMTSYKTTIASNIEQQKVIVKPPLPWLPTLQ